MYIILFGKMINLNKLKLNKTGQTCLKIENY